MEKSKSPSTKVFINTGLDLASDSGYSLHWFKIRIDGIYNIVFSIYVELFLKMESKSPPKWINGQNRWSNIIFVGTIL